MAIDTFLQRFVESNMAFVHAFRRETLCAAALSLMDGAHLTLSAVGRRLGGSARTKHKIKRIDRLLGNARLHAERAKVYEALSRWALSGRQRPLILIDWSDVESGNRFQMLKAAAVVDGRALTLYEEVHPVKGCKRSKVEQRFLVRLGTLVPANCRPIVVTDAGFLGPWFKSVVALGWDYVGRVRGGQQVRLDGEENWRPIKQLHALATTAARSLGEGWAAKRHPYRTRVCVVQEFKPKRGRRRGDRAKNPKWREPWVLYTSLCKAEANAATVVNVYRKRMQIEENFRDLKTPRFGFAMTYARSTTIARRETLLLVAALATFALWLIGLAARAAGWHRHFQANTVTKRQVLSAVFLGREVHRHPSYTVNDEMLETAASLLVLNIGTLNDIRVP